MNRILLPLLVPTLIFANNQKNTYEQIRDQLAEEADERVQAVQNGFAQEYRPLILKLGLSSFLAGAFFFFSVFSPDSSFAFFPFLETTLLLY